MSPFHEMSWTAIYRDREQVKGHSVQAVVREQDKISFGEKCCTIRSDEIHSMLKTRIPQVVGW